MLTKEEKTKLIEKYKLHNEDTGSPDVQVAILSEEIERLQSHLKKHQKDIHSKRGLLKMVSKRRKFLNYLRDIDASRYASVLKKIGLKK
ncbi:MAG TPA: 30S ribosomal protein S15 [Candidatus Paceibacterota bacterium]|nr:30S ribosomal protein S15 [Candidatus Pacearchaeota archaeon]HRZ51212.1 30S ribosomal protein S15 [Candidatus Paceibacterota bacterium]HSA36934.1 30S ribosomal protein S15 [Candidatus Paceibacterota bacterium]